MHGIRAKTLTELRALEAQALHRGAVDTAARIGQEIEKRKSAVKLVAVRDAA